MNTPSSDRDGWASTVGRLSADVEERFWHLWIEMARSQLRRGAWTPSLGEVARLAWGFLIDVSEFQRSVRTRFLEQQIDFAEQRIATLMSRREEPEPLSAPPSGDSLGSLQ